MVLMLAQHSSGYQLACSFCSRTCAQDGDAVHLRFACCCLPLSAHLCQKILPCTAVLVEGLCLTCAIEACAAHAEKLLSWLICAITAVTKATFSEGSDMLTQQALVVEKACYEAEALPAGPLHGS